MSRTDNKKEAIRNTRNFRAAVLDMDGVITQTAKVHARAWKQMFDEYLAKRGRRQGESLAPFDIERDYRSYVDGKPRYDGVRSFLESRGIELPFGDPSDSVDRETVCGLGNRKNEIFHQLLEQDGVETYEDTVRQISNWKRAGWKVAVISSSRNCEAVLQAAEVRHLFDARVDGTDIDRLDMPGKPAPDMFLHAARELGVSPDQVVVVEDAIAGIEAGRKGNFGLVIGVAREQNEDGLRRAGADHVVRDLRELRTVIGSAAGAEDSSGSPHAMQNTEWLAERLRGRALALFLDYDGTLTPIVRRPEDATLPDETRALLAELAGHCTLAIISGRDRRDAQNMVQLDNLIYAGSHGFDIQGPDGLELQQEDATRALPDLDRAEQEVHEAIASISGAHVERKRFAIAVHFREIADRSDVTRVEQAVDAACRRHPALRKRGGKKIFELQPDVPWDKGQAVLWLTRALGLDRPDVVVIYLGDDVTDEDAFAVLADREGGLGIRVGPPDSGTRATRILRDCDEVRQFLQLLLDMLT